MPFKIHTGQIVEHQRDALEKALLVELLLDADPVSVQLIHGGIQVVLVEVFGGLIQATGRGQQGAASVIDQGQFGAGKQNTTQDHGLEQTGHPSIRNEVKDRAQAKLFPGLVQDHQPAAIPGFAQLQRLCSHKAASLKGLADELAGLRGQRRDIADGAGARALWGTKGLANQVGEVGDAAVLAFGDLHEHTCYIEAHIFINASQILTNLDLLLATFLTEILVSQRFSHFEREVRLAARIMPTMKVGRIRLAFFSTRVESEPILVDCLRLLLVNPSFFHHKLYVFQQTNVFERIARNRDDVGVSSRLEGAEEI